MLICSMTQGAFAQQTGVNGKVVSTTNATAVEFANVVLQTTDSLFIVGTTTNEEGVFNMEKLAKGEYRLVVSAIGYKTTYQPVILATGSNNIGSIIIEEDIVSLGTVIASASNLTSTADRKLVYPSDRQIKASTNGMNLLQQLMLPKLQINLLLNEVSVPGGGEVQFRINGSKVELQDIIALTPEEIIRVEYHDNPGLRYGNAEVVLDYIVRRPETGGSFGTELSDAVNVAWGNNYIRGKVNHKKSEFAVNYGISHRDFYRAWRDNEEKFLFPDGSVLHRREEGEPGHAQLSWQNLNATYSYALANKRMFNATFRYYTNNNPHWDYKGVLYNVASPTDKVNMIDFASRKMHRPAIDLYYQERLPNQQTIIFNVVGTYNRSDESRLYSESRNGEMLTDVHNLIKGNKYSIIGEGIYEKKLGDKRISGGIQYIRSFSDNKYENGHNFETKMNQSETSAYVEFNGKLKSLDYTLSGRISRSWFAQEDSEGYENYTFNPRIVLHYNLPGKQFIRLKASASNATPGLSELSEIEQVIDSIQIQRGNPGLKPYMRYSTELTYEYQKGIFYTNLWTIYEYQPKAIMDEKRIDNNKIVQTWDNQKNWQRFANRLTVRVGPIKDILQVSVAGGVNHYVSNGNEYKHRYTNWFASANVSATYKKFTLGGGLETNWNWFFGETMHGGENIHYILLSYKHKNISLGAGMFNPFVDNYKQESENRSHYASYKKSNSIKESSRMCMIRFSYNFSFGRKFTGSQKRVSNSDDDAGVMRTGK